MRGALKPDGDEIVQLEFFSPSNLPPRPLWYADMVSHAQAGRYTQVALYFDPPEQKDVDTLYPTLMSMRHVVGAAPLLWPGAAAVVRDEAGRILLQQRGDSGLWGLPAGALDTGETLAHTAIRETLEETGLCVEPLRLLNVLAGYEVVHSNGDRLFPVAHTFECRAIGGQLRVDGDESLAVGFFAPEGLPPLHPTMRQRIHQVLGLESAPLV